ncbi:MAG TPA: hypothetical protein VFE16_07100 [Candidatus Cybelea sp.]|nr:hypothetical protein [Candidatus Cybelea sp.]
MIFFYRTRSAFALSIAVILHGCGGALTAKPATVASWMNPSAGRGETTLLYAGNLRGNVVNVYDFKDGSLVGMLSGFNEPTGGCVDRYGDVFITEYGNDTTLELTHGGTKVLNRYTMNASAVGCSVDAAGDLAVVEEPQESGRDGVCIWKGGKGPRACYSNDQDCGIMASPGYDNQGNLYVEGTYYAPSICELPAGGNALRTVTLSGATLHFQGGVMWDGKHLTLSDPHFAASVRTTALYRVTEAASGSGNLTVVGTTVLKGSCNQGGSADVQPFILGPRNTPINDREGKSVVGADSLCSQGVIDVWHYAKGGDPVRDWSAPFFPQGVVISRPR